MFFTDNSWKAAPRLTGALCEPFDRWRMVGLSRATPTFIVRHAGVDYSDADTYMLLVAGAESLVSLLSEPWPVAPEVFALVHDRMIAVDELWSYRAPGRKRTRYFAWREKPGELVPCELNQPAPAQAVDRVCLWKGLCGVSAPVSDI
jgi:hypothetical protein